MDDTNKAEDQASVENETGDTGTTITKNTQNKYSCKACAVVCSTTFNLRRHINRAHSGNQELINETLSGRAVCLQCGGRFLQIVFLRDHLVKEHNFKFEEEDRHFANILGNIILKELNSIFKEMCKN